MEKRNEFSSEMMFLFDYESSAFCEEASLLIRLLFIKFVEVHDKIGINLFTGIRGDSNLY